MEILTSLPNGSSGHDEIHWEDYTDWNDWPDCCPENLTEDQAYSAFDCVADYSTAAEAAEITNTEIDALVYATVLRIDYVSVMQVFYNYMAAARIIFSIILLVYQFQKYYLNFKLTRFQRLVLYMIQSLTVL